LPLSSFWLLLIPIHGSWADISVCLMGEVTSLWFDLFTSVLIGQPAFSGLLVQPAIKSTARTAAIMTTMLLYFVYFSLLILI
jgi:hypothetical protein